MGLDGIEIVGEISLDQLVALGPPQLQSILPQTDPKTNQLQAMKISNMIPQALSSLNTVPSNTKVETISKGVTMKQNETSTQSQGILNQAMDIALKNSGLLPLSVPVSSNSNRSVFYSGSQARDVTSQKHSAVDFVRIAPKPVCVSPDIKSLEARVDKENSAAQALKEMSASHVLFCKYCGSDIKDDVHHQCTSRKEAKNFLCSICPPSQQNLMSSKEFKLHNQTCHGSKFHCRYCSQEYEDEDSCNLCNCRQGMNKVYYCSFCPKEHQIAYSSADLARHQLEKHLNKTSIIKVTTDVSARIDQINKEALKSTSTSEVSPVTSGALTSKESSFVRDVDVDLDIQKEQSSSKMASLQSSQQKSTKATITRMELKELKEAARDDDGYYQCDQCSQKFTMHCNLRRHKENIHLGKKEYTCEICSKGFHRRHELLQHQLVHIEDTPYHCMKCPRAFKTEKLLTVHENSHNDTLTPCEYCDKRFYNESERDVHVWEKHHEHAHQYKCGVCKAIYLAEPRAQEHIAFHRGERQADISPDLFECKICANVYISQKLLDKHELMHQRAINPNVTHHVKPLTVMKVSNPMQAISSNNPQHPIPSILTSVSDMQMGSLSKPKISETSKLS